MFIPLKTRVKKSTEYSLLVTNPNILFFCSFFVFSTPPTHPSKTKKCYRVVVVFVAAPISGSTRQIIWEFHFNHHLLLTAAQPPCYHIYYYRIYSKNHSASQPVSEHQAHSAVSATLLLPAARHLYHLLYAIIRSMIETVDIIIICLLRGVAWFSFYYIYYMNDR